MSKRFDPFVGAWKLIPDLSQFDANHGPTSATLVFEFDDNGYHRMKATGVNREGEPVEEAPQMFITDERPRPLPGFPQLTVVSVRPDANTLHARVTRPDGSLVGESLMVVSPDGRSLVATNSGVDAQLRTFQQRTVWERAERMERGGPVSQPRASRALMLVLGICVMFAQPARAQSTADTVVEWNRILLAVAGANPPTVFITRPIAMVHVAMFDALNSIDPQYDYYATRAFPPPGASLWRPRRRPRVMYDADGRGNADRAAVGGGRDHD